MEEQARTITVMLCHCVRCNWDWTSRSEGKPKRCAKCKSGSWEEPVKQPHRAGVKLTTQNPRPGAAIGETRYEPFEG